MTADIVAALVALLAADASVAALTGPRVFGIELPAAEAAAMPRKALVLRAAGGAALTSGYAGIGAQRIDLYSYGETPYQAALLDRTVHAVLKQLRRRVSAGVLIHWVGDAGGYLQFRDPDTDWPAVFRSWQAAFAEASLAPT